MSDDLTTEVAKEAIKESIVTAKEFVSKLISPGLEEGGGIIQDNIKFWRFKNQINILNKAKVFLEKKGLEPSKVLPKTLLPLLDKGSLEETDDLQDKWAALLANAANPEINDLIKPSFVEILNELSPIEVKLLDKLYEKINNSNEQDKIKIQFYKDEIIKLLDNISEDHYYLIVENLYRLNIIQPPSSESTMSIIITDDSSDGTSLATKTSDIICITKLGMYFIKACSEGY